MQKQEKENQTGHSRVLKFRAWDKVNEKMVDVIDFACMNHPDKYEVMQFTGLKDKNGKEIYEGDILLIPDTYINQITEDGGPTEDEPHLSEVIFWESAFGAKIRESGVVFNSGFVSFTHMGEEISLMNGKSEIEIIGNIYENPDLIK